MSFNALIKQNYLVLIESEAVSLETAFYRESKLRKKFNLECINMVDTVCKNDILKVSLPAEYSIKSIITEIICTYLTSYRTKRIKILNVAKTVVRQLGFLKLVNKENVAKHEEQLFIFLSKAYLIKYSIKCLMLNVARIFFRLKAKLNIKDNKQDKKYLICINFPRYAFVKQSITRTSQQSEDLDKSLSFANYLLSTGDAKERKILSIGEYDQDFWETSLGAHLENALDRDALCRKLASPLTVFKQLGEQLYNIRIAFEIYSSLNNNGIINKVLIFFGLLNYFTQFAEIFGFVKKASKNNSIKLIFNANAFYVFPWYGYMVSDKSHYMYADNCCYFPFAYFSPSKELKHSPILNSSSELMYGFLEWPIYYRTIGGSDIGYQGVARLSNSLSRLNVSEKFEKDENISLPLQIGSIKALDDSSAKGTNSYSSEEIKNKTVLFIDSKTIYPEQQYSSVDVPTVFYSPEVSEHYYRSFMDIANSRNVSILIKPKYLVSNILLSVIEEISGQDTINGSDVSVISPTVSLHETIISINPDVLLIRPMSSTYLFTELLGFEPHYFIPDSILNIFEDMKGSLNSSKYSKDNWLNEKGLINILDA